MADLGRWQPYSAAHAGAMSLYDAECIGSWRLQSAPSLVTWPSANRALFFPYRLAVPFTVCKFVIGWGVSAGSNFDLGIYDQAGNLMVSTGGTAASGTSQEQVVDCTDTLLLPGLYYMAMARDAAASANGWTQNTFHAQMAGIRQMASAYPLPSTATFASVSTATFALFQALGRGT